MEFLQIEENELWAEAEITDSNRAEKAFEYICGPLELRLETLIKILFFLLPSKRRLVMIVCMN